MKNNSLNTIILLTIILFLIFLTRDKGYGPLSFLSSNRGSRNKEKAQVLYTRVVGKEVGEQPEEKDDKKSLKVLYSRKINN